MAVPQVAPEVAADLGKLLLSLTHNPKTRKTIAKAIKEIDPDSPHAQAFADVDVQDQFEKFKQEQADREIENQRKAVMAEMNAKRNALLTGGPDGSGRKYGEDDIKKIETLMEKKGITDYEDGATLYAATLPPLDPKPSDMPIEHGATWEFPEWSKFSENPDKAARNTAHTVITEFMRKR